MTTLFLTFFLDFLNLFLNTALCSGMEAEITTMKKSDAAPKNPPPMPKMTSSFTMEVALNRHLDERVERMGLGVSKGAVLRALVAWSLDQSDEAIWDLLKNANKRVLEMDL